jgi:hypothetical protein
MTKNKTVFGIYSSRGEIAPGINALRESGFAQSDVSVLLPENLGSNELVTEKETKAPDTALAGASSGAVLGGALGWLVGIGALIIPGIGPLVAAGPILGILAGAGVGGALGGFAGALVGVGIPEHEATKYEKRLAAGAILVAVHCRSSREAKRAKMIMATSGADDIASAAESCDSKNAA